MFEKRRARKQQEAAREAFQMAVVMQQQQTLVDQCTGLVMSGQEVRFPAQLWESRAVRNSQWVSQRVWEGGRVGASRSESHDVMRQLDQGVFTIGPQRAFFVGGLAQRVWEYAKVLDWGGDQTSLSIAVSNRQKVSGVSFEGGAPVAQMFSLAIARYQQG